MKKFDTNSLVEFLKNAIDKKPNNIRLVTTCSIEEIADPDTKDLVSKLSRSVLSNNKPNWTLRYLAVLVSAMYAQKRCVFLLSQTGFLQLVNATSWTRKAKNFQEVYNKMMFDLTTEKILRRTYVGQKNIKEASAYELCLPSLLELFESWYPKDLLTAQRSEVEAFVSAKMDSALVPAGHEALISIDNKEKKDKNIIHIAPEQFHPFSRTPLIQDIDALHSLHSKLFVALHGRFYEQDGPGTIEKVANESESIWQLMVLNEESWGRFVDDLIHRRFNSPGTQWDPNGSLAAKARSIFTSVYLKRQAQLQHIAQAVAKRDHTFFTSTEDFLLKVAPADIRQEIVDRIVRSRKSPLAAPQSDRTAAVQNHTAAIAPTQPEATQAPGTGDLDTSIASESLVDYGSGESGVDFEKMTRDNIVCRQIDDKPRIIAFGFSDLPAHPWYRNPKVAEPKEGFVKDLLTAGVRPDGSVRAEDGNVYNDVGRLSVADRVLDTIDMSGKVGDDDDDAQLLRELGMTNVVSYVDDLKETT